MMNDSDDRVVRGVVIDPGHGGEDSGAIGNNQYEKDYTLKISRYMYDRLKELGIPVSITRDSDVTLNPKDRVSKILSFYGDDPNVIVVSNHLNSGGGTGAEVIYALRNNPTLANSILNNIGNLGQKTRKIYQRTLPTDSSKDYYFIHRNTGTVEPVIVEYGFIDDASNIDFLNNNYKELAEAVIKAIANYGGYTYKEPTSNLEYVVKKGDTLYGISKMYNVSVDDIKKYNGLTSNDLSIGKVLKIPNTLNVYDSYTVKRGDTLYSIARKYNTTVDNLRRLNNLNNDSLSIGQVILLPGVDTSSDNTSIYVVNPGDTLYSIAREYDTTVEVLKDLNTLTTNILSVGQKLVVPSDNSNIYVVKRGDTLYSIAKKYNITVDRIRQLNNLSSNNLSIGEKLIIR